MSSKLLQPGRKVPELRIILVGKTGVGKTSAMNVLLGKPCLTKTTASSQTTECKIEEREFEGQKLVLIDTPGLMNTEKDKAQVEKDIVGCIAAAAPGPHVFLLVMKAEPLTATDKYTVEIIRQLFGKESNKFTLALFTCGDTSIPTDEQVQVTFLPDYIVGHFSFDNKGNTHPDQVRELLEKINNMVQNNKGAHYTSEMLKEAQKVKEREMEKLKGDGGEQHVLRKTVEFLLSKMVDERLAGFMLKAVDFACKTTHKLVN